MIGEENRGDSRSEDFWDAERIAAALASTLFPDSGYADAGYSPEDIHAARARDGAPLSGVSAFPPGTLTAIAAIYPALTGEGQQFIAKLANDALHSPDAGTGPLRALDNALLFVPLLDAVAEAYGQPWRWVEYRAALNWALQVFEEGAEPQGEVLWSDREAERDYRSLTPKEQADAEAFVLAALLAALTNTPLDECSVAVTRANLSHPDRVASVAAERGTFDPAVVKGVLDGPTTALADGTL